MKKNILFFLFVFCSVQSVFSKILIIVPVYNRPDFIEYQHKTFKKFLKDEYELVIFYDAKNSNMAWSIESVCKKYLLRCIRIPQKIHNQPYLERPATGFSSCYQTAWVRNSYVVQYALNTVGFDHNDIVAIVDSDIFLVQEFSIHEYMQETDFAAYFKPCNACPKHDCKKLHPKIKSFSWPWIGLVFLNMPTLPNRKTMNFNCGKLYEKIPVDPGGFVHYYLRDNKVKEKHFDRICQKYLFCSSCKSKLSPTPACTHNLEALTAMGLGKETIYFLQKLPDPGFGKIGRPIEIFLNGKFIHFRCGTNYTNFSGWFNSLKESLFRDFMNQIT